MLGGGGGSRVLMRSIRAESLNDSLKLGEMETSGVGIAVVVKKMSWW